MLPESSLLSHNSGDPAVTAVCRLDAENWKQEPHYAHNLRM